MVAWKKRRKKGNQARVGLCVGSRAAKRCSWNGQRVLLERVILRKLNPQREASSLVRRVLWPHDGCLRAATQAAAQTMFEYRDFAFSKCRAKKTRSSRSLPDPGGSCMARMHAVKERCKHCPRTPTFGTPSGLATCGERSVDGRDICGNIMLGRCPPASGKDHRPQAPQNNLLEGPFASPGAPCPASSRPWLPSDCCFFTSSPQSTSARALSILVSLEEAAGQTKMSRE